MQPITLFCWACICLTALVLSFLSGQYSVIDKAKKELKQLEDYASQLVMERNLLKCKIVELEVQIQSLKDNKEEWRAPVVRFLKRVK